jgi:hypothetical protein
LRDLATASVSIPLHSIVELAACVALRSRQVFGSQLSLH